MKDAEEKPAANALTLRPKISKCATETVSDNYDQNTPSPSTATSQVLAIPELRELILYYVPGSDLLVQRRTCKAFNAFVLFHPNIRTRLFFDPSDKLLKVKRKTRLSIRANDIVFRPAGTINLPGWSARNLKQFSFRIRSFAPNLLRLFLSSTDPRPLMVVNASSDALLSDLKRISRTPWADMYLTDPAMPTKLRIYTHARAFWQYATLEIMPATFRQMLEIVLVVWYKDGLARDSGRELDRWIEPGFSAIVHRWKWTRAGRDEVRDGMYRDGQTDMFRLMNSRPVFFETEDMDVLSALKDAGMAMA